MARYRSIQTSFWQDNFIVKLPLMEKAFYSYLLTNCRTTQCGIYNFSVTFTAIELNIGEEEVRELINKFISYGKILYDASNEEIMILNWYKYNLSTSRNTLICINRELYEVKNKDFIRRFYELCKSKKYAVEIIFDGIDCLEELILADQPEKAKDNRVNLKEVVKEFSTNIHLVTPLELEDLKDWCEKLNEEIVILAIKEAVRNNARNIKYINGILINWHREGLKTAQEAEAFMKQWQGRAAYKTSKLELPINAPAYKVIGEVPLHG